MGCGRQQSVLNEDKMFNPFVFLQVSRNPYFKMLPTKGSLVLKRPLDKEARDVIEMTVTAVDHGSPSLQATARVQVRGQTFGQLFSRLIVLIELPICIITNVSRQLTIKNDIWGPLQANLRCCPVVRSLLLHLHLAKSFFWGLGTFPNTQESFKHFALYLKVFIADRNDHTPVFDDKNYLFTVTENSRPGIVLGSVHANDEDKGKNGEIEYRLRTTIKKFSIEPKSGVDFLNAVKNVKETFIQCICV